MPDDRLNTKSLPQRTADAIVNLLHTQNLRVGAKLPGEQELAAKFEVSRSTVRAALSILREKGILRTERGAGTFVADYRNGSDTEYDPLGLSLIYDKKKLVMDLLDVRLMIEPRCALLAAQNAVSRDIETLFHICDEFDALIAAGKSYVDMDMEFHLAVANCSGNPVLHNLIPYIHQMQILTNRIAPRRRQLATASEHRKIAEAIRDRRGADAYDLMQFHLNIIRERFAEDGPN